MLSTRNTVIHTVMIGLLVATLVPIGAAMCVGAMPVIAFATTLGVVQSYGALFLVGCAIGFVSSLFIQQTPDNNDQSKENEENEDNDHSREEDNIIYDKVVIHNQYIKVNLLKNDTIYDAKSLVEQFKDIEYKHSIRNSEYWILLNSEVAKKIFTYTSADSERSYQILYFPRAIKVATVEELDGIISILEALELDRKDENHSYLIAKKNQLILEAQVLAVQTLFIVKGQIPLIIKELNKSLPNHSWLNRIKIENYNLDYKNTIHIKTFPKIIYKYCKMENNDLEFKRDDESNQTPFFKYPDLLLTMKKYLFLSESLLNISEQKDFWKKTTEINLLNQICIANDIKIKNVDSINIKDLQQYIANNQNNCNYWGEKLFFQKDSLKDFKQLIVELRNSLNNFLTKELANKALKLSNIRGTFYVEDIKWEPLGPNGIIGPDILLVFLSDSDKKKSFLFYNSKYENGEKLETYIFNEDFLKNHCTKPMLALKDKDKKIEYIEYNDFFGDEELTYDTDIQGKVEQNYIKNFLMNF